MSVPTRFYPAGVTNVGPNDALARYGLPDPSQWHTYFDDFDYFNSGDWTITTTEAGTGSASEALGDEDGGVLVITNDDADDDNDFLQKVGESFLLESGKKTYFKARFKVSDATQSDFVMGLQITDTSPLDVSDGVFFQKDDGDTNLDVHVEKDGTASSSTDVHTMEDDTYVVVAFYYNGDDEVKFFVNNGAVANLSTDNLPDDEALTISFGLQNGAAAAKSMTCDYIFAAKER